MVYTVKWSQHMKTALFVGGLLAVLCVLHLLASWMEQRGWIYYIHRKPNPTSLGTALLELAEAGSTPTATCLGSETQGTSRGRAGRRNGPIRRMREAAGPSWGELPVREFQESFSHLLNHLPRSTSRTRTASCYNKFKGRGVHFSGRSGGSGDGARGPNPTRS